MSLGFDTVGSLGPPALRWDKLERGGIAVLRLQIVAGVLVGLAYLAAVGLGIGPLPMLLGLGAAGVAVIWPVTGLATLAVVLGSREPDILAPIYVNAILIGAIGVGCIFRLAGDRRPVRIHPGLVLFVAYALYTGLSILPPISGYPADWMPTAMLQFIRLSSGAGLFLVASYVFRRVPSGPIVAIGLLGASLATLTGIVAALNLPGIAPAIDGLLNPERGTRAVGGFGSANYYGFFAAQAFILTAGLWFAAPRYRGIIAVVLAIVVTGVVLSFSRSAYLASMVGLIVIAASRNLKVAIVMAILAAVAAAVLYPAFIEARVGADVLDPDVTVQRALSEDWRRRSVAAGLELFSREPFFGIGFGVFHHLSPEFIGASPATFTHNQYISFLAEQGLVGVAMVAGIVGSLALAVWRSPHALRGTAMAMGAAYILQSTFINSATAFQISGLTWLVLAAVLSPARDDVPSSTKET